MAIRFSDSELWNRDWFLDLDGKFKLFCLYLRDACDHAGVWQPAFKRFEQSTGFRINPTEYLEACNRGRTRIVVLENGKWWITGFVSDQYKTFALSEHYNPHKGILNSLHFNNAPYLSYGYKLRVGDSSLTLKDKDKDKDKDNLREDNIINTIGHKKKEKKIFESESFEMRLSLKMWEFIQKIGTTQKQPDLQAWSRVFEEIHRVDHRPYDFIYSVVSSAFDDSFWRGTLRSPGKLREHLNAGKMDSLVPRTYLTDEELILQNERPRDAVNKAFTV